MSGGLTQLVAIGAQDVFLTGDPQVSFFRSNFKRHTNFAQGVEEQVIEGKPSNNGFTGIHIQKKGDMLSYIYLSAITAGGTSNETFDWSTVIDRVDLLVGGQIIDTQDFTYNRSIAPQTSASSVSRSNLGIISSDTAYFFPLKFFFCENWSSAIPLVALQYQDVEIHIHWGTTVGNRRFQCFANFIYLDEIERKNLADNTSDILITQVQKTIVPSSGPNTVALNYNHPVKFIASTASELVSDDSRVKLSFERC